MYIWAVFHGIYRAKSCTQKLMSIAMCHFKDRFLTKIRKSTVNVVVSGYGGSNKCGVFAGTYFHVRIICMCFIKRIRFYVHGSRVLFVLKSPNCELFWLFVCMDVWSWCSKTLSFYTGFPCPCTLPHERAKNVPKRSPGVRFHGGFGKVSF